METEVLVSTMNLKSQQELVKKLNVKKKCNNQPDK